MLGQLVYHACIIEKTKQLQMWSESCVSGVRMCAQGFVKVQRTSPCVAIQGHVCKVLALTCNSLSVQADSCSYNALRVQLSNSSRSPLEIVLRPINVDVLLY
jgi:hypothetical protein